jgi:hypothetical protein
MVLVALASLNLVLAQTPPAETDAERAATAALRAAEAALKAAEAAERSAAAAAKVAAGRPAEAAAAPAAAAPKKVSDWTGSVGASLISLAGNATTITFSGTASLTRTWGLWSLGVKAAGAYGQSRPPDGSASQVTAMSAGAEFRGERSFSPMISVFAGLGGDTDHVKSIEFRGFGEGGVSVTWLDDKQDDFQKERLSTDLGLRYARELLFQYFPTPANPNDRDILGPRVGAKFRYALSRDVIFSEEAEVLPSLLGTVRTLVSSNTKLSSRLTESLTLTVGFLAQYDSVPAPGRVNVDTALTAGVELGL